MDYRDRYCILLTFSFFVVLYNALRVGSLIIVDLLVVVEAHHQSLFFHQASASIGGFKNLSARIRSYSDSEIDLRIGTVKLDAYEHRSPCSSQPVTINDIGIEFEHITSFPFKSPHYPISAAGLTYYGGYRDYLSTGIARKDVVIENVTDESLKGPIMVNYLCKNPDGFKSIRSMRELLKHMDNAWRKWIFGNCEVWNGVYTFLGEFWNENNVRMIIHYAGVWTSNIYDMTGDKVFEEEVETYERYIEQSLESGRITYVRIAPIPRHLDEGINTREEVKKIERMYSCSVIPFYSKNKSIYDMKYRRYISGILVDYANSTPNLYVTLPDVRSITPLQRLVPSFNKDPNDDVPTTHDDCFLKGIEAAIFKYSVGLTEYNTVREIKLIYGHRTQYEELSREKMRKILSNPYEDFYDFKKMRYTQGLNLHSPHIEKFQYWNRNSAPNLFNFGTTELLDTLFSNKKRIHKPYPNEIASRASDEVVKYILKNKIEKTSDLLAGGNSMIECLGLTLANKFLSNAYTLASHYIEENVESISAGKLLKPMYVEPVFVISAAQAFYCTLIRDEYSLLRHKFMNPSYEGCPFVYVFMYVTFDRLDLLTGRPIPYVNTKILFDACKEEPNEITWVPKESCVSPDPYLLPFGLRTTLKNVRVLNIMDIIKSEDNLRNINYSLNLSTKLSAIPDDHHIYECEAKKCENHLLEILGFDIMDKMYPHAISNGARSLRNTLEHDGSLDENCPFDRKVIPDSYSAFNVKPFIPATGEEMIRIGKYDMGHMYSSVPHGGINRREDTLEYGLWDLISPNLNRHKYITDVASDMSQYNIDSCYSRLWAFNYTMNGRADFESHTINNDLLELSKSIRINGRPFVGMSYSPFIDDVM